MPSRGFLKTYQNMRSYARDYSSTQTKFHVDPCRDDRVTGVTADRQTDVISALYSLPCRAGCRPKIDAVHGSPL